MLGDTDLTDIHAVERIRRSIAMLPAHRQGVLDREEALTVLDAIADLLRARPAPT